MANERWANAGSSTLNGSITNVATSLVVTSAASFPTAGNFRLLIDNEYLLVTSVSGTTFTVTRAIESSSAASHSNGAAVVHLLTAGSLAQITTDHLAPADPHANVYQRLSTITTKGDIAVGTGSGATSRLAAAADGSVTTTDSSQTTGLTYRPGFVQSATTAVVAGSGTITTSAVTVARVAPAGAVTGIILQCGTFAGQEVWVANEATAANSVTFAASGTSHVAGGTAAVIAGGAAQHFIWDTSTSLWYASPSATVTSVALTMPAEFSVSGTPVTSGGTLAVTKATETANTVWAGPTSGSAAQPAFRALVTSDIPGTPYVLVQDQKTQNTDGGTFTSGAFQTRTLNTIVTDTASIASLSTNQITLPAGTYLVRIAAPAFSVDRHQARLRNITGSSTTLTGRSSVAAGSVIGGVGWSESIIVGRFTIAGSTAFEVQNQCQTTKTTNGFGVASNFTTEIYTSVEIWKVA